MSTFVLLLLILPCPCRNTNKQGARKSSQAHKSLLWARHCPRTGKVVELNALQCQATSGHPLEGAIMQLASRVAAGQHSQLLCI